MKLLKPISALVMVLVFGAVMSLATAFPPPREKGKRHAVLVTHTALGGQPVVAGIREAAATANLQPVPATTAEREETITLTNRCRRPGDTPEAVARNGSKSYAKAAANPRQVSRHRQTRHGGRLDL